MTPVCMIWYGPIGRVRPLHRDGVPMAVMVLTQGDGGAFLSRMPVLSGFFGGPRCRLPPSSPRLHEQPKKHRIRPLPRTVAEPALRWGCDGPLLQASKQATASRVAVGPGHPLSLHDASR